MFHMMTRFVVLAILVGAAVMVAFFAIGLIFRLLVIGAIVIGIIALIAAFKKVA